MFRLKANEFKRQTEGLAPARALNEVERFAVKTKCILAGTSRLTRMHGLVLFFSIYFFVMPRKMVFADPGFTAGKKGNWGGCSLCKVCDYSVMAP